MRQLPGIQSGLIVRQGTLPMPEARDGLMQVGARKMRMPSKSVIAVRDVQGSLNCAIDVLSTKASIDARAANHDDQQFDGFRSKGRARHILIPVKNIAQKTAKLE